MEQDTQISDQDPKPSQKSSTSPGLVLFRLLLTVITAVLLGGVIYFGTTGWIPFLDKNIFQSVSNNQSQIEGIVLTQEALADELSDISATLDVSRGNEDDILSGYQATLTRIEADLENLSEGLESAQASIDTNSQINTYMATAYPQKLFEIEEKQENNSRFVEAIATAQMRAAGIDEDLALIRILDLFSRANQFLLHSNYGLAEEALGSAKGELGNLLETAPGFQREYIDSILKHVENAIYHLPAKPALAANELELAWQLGINGLPKPMYLDSNLTRTPTPTLTPYPQITLTPTPP
jgi:hypothetical protein